MWTTGRGSLAVVVITLLLVGCGESDEATEVRIARERKDAAQDARRDGRLRQLERERAGPESGGGSGGQSPAAPPSSRTACGDSISAGPNTTCSFARNVVDAYRESGGSSSIEVYSPVTGETYTMSCTAGVTTVCSGGNNATVYFR